MEKMTPYYRAEAYFYQARGEAARAGIQFPVELDIYNCRDELEEYESRVIQFLKNLRFEVARKTSYPPLMEICYCRVSDVEGERCCWKRWDEIPANVQQQIETAAKAGGSVEVMVTYDAIRLRWKRSEMDYVVLGQAVCLLDRKSCYPAWVQEPMEADHARASVRPKHGYDITADPRLWP